MLMAMPMRLKSVLSRSVAKIVWRDAENCPTLEMRYEPTPIMHSVRNRTVKFVHLSILT